MHFAFYSQRSAIPREVEFDIVQGMPGPERVVDTKKGLFREIEADIVMSFAGAVQLYLWLGGQLNVTRQQMGISDADWNGILQGKK